jgi:uncharacterized membrane protein
LSASLYESTAKRVLISQASLLTYSALLAVLGYGKYVFLLIIVFWILVTYIQSRLGKGPLGHGRAKPEDLLASRKLYEEKNAREIQMKDKELFREIQEQSRATMYMSLGALIGFIYFLILWPHIGGIAAAVSAKLGEGKLSLFIAYLIYFEGYFIISQATQLYGLRKVGTITTISTPQAYTVTEKGIVMHGIVGKSAIPFPIPRDVRIELDEKRGFVELVKTGKRTVVKIRFYARSPRRLWEVMKRKAYEAEAATPRGSGYRG